MSAHRASSTVAVTLATAVLGFGAAYLVERTDLPLRAVSFGCAGAAAGRAGVRAGLLLGLAHVERPRLLGRAAGDELLAVPAGLPAGRGEPAPQRPGAGGGVAQPGHGRWAPCGG